MKEKEKHLGLRLDDETHRKLKSLSEFEGRSINGEVIYLIRQAIKKFEKENGNLDQSKGIRCYAIYCGNECLSF